MMARPQNRSHRRHRKLPRNNLREETNRICKKTHTTSHTHTPTHIIYKCRKRDILHRQQHDTQLSYTNNNHSCPRNLVSSPASANSQCLGSLALVVDRGASHPQFQFRNLDQEVFLWNSTSLLTWCLKHLTTLQVVASYESHQQRDNTQKTQKPTKKQLLLVPSNVSPFGLEFLLPNEGQNERDAEGGEFPNVWSWF